MVLRNIVIIIGITYLGLQALLAFHLLFSPPKEPRDILAKSEDVGQVSKRLIASRKNLIQAVLKIYRLQYSNAIMKYYAPEVTFQDPTMFVSGKKNLARVGSGLDAFLSTEDVTLKVLDVVHGQHVIFLSIQASYTTKLIGYRMSLPALLTLTLKGREGSEVITQHDDEWYSKPLLGPDAPYGGLGNVAQQFRKLHAFMLTCFFSPPEGYEE